MDNRLDLYFGSGPSPELIRTVFVLEAGTVCSAVRGKTAGAYRGYGTFQWTSAVRGVVECALSQLVAALDPESMPYISGERGSIASSLDYALSKRPAWLGEMFGVSKNGECYARRLFRVTNPNLKRPGPVTIAVNSILLPAGAITVHLDGRQLSSLQDLKSLQELLRNGAGGWPASEGEKLAA